MKKLTIFSFFGIFQGCVILSPYEVAQQDISSIYKDAKGNHKIGYWSKDSKSVSKESENPDLRACVSTLTLENSGTGTVRATVASAQLVNCMRSKGWELKFEQVML